MIPSLRQKCFFKTTKYCFKVQFYFCLPTKYKYFLFFFVTLYVYETRKHFIIVFLFVTIAFEDSAKMVMKVFLFKCFFQIIVEFCERFDPKCTHFFSTCIPRNSPIFRVILSFYRLLQKS